MVNGKKATWTEKESTNGLMETFIKENIVKARNVEEAECSGETRIKCMMAIGRKDCR